MVAAASLTIWMRAGIPNENRRSIFQIPLFYFLFKPCGIRVYCVIFYENSVPRQEYSANLKFIFDVHDAPWSF